MNVSTSRHFKWKTLTFPNYQMEQVGEIFKHVSDRKLLFYVCSVEQGKFLALDLGGTNFRVILLEIENGQIVQEIVKMYHIGSHLRVGGLEVATALFDYIGECLCDFVAENNLVAVPLPLGFVMQQFLMNPKYSHIYTHS